MLKKLIKYDFKALNRYLLLIHGFLLISALAVRFFLTERLSISVMENQTGSMLLVGIFILYSLLIGATSFATTLLIAIRFYKNLYSDEGYLTFTLPVSRSQLLLSKTIAGVIWCFINQVLIMASLAIVILTSDVVSLYHANRELFWEAAGFLGGYTAALPGKLLLLFLVFLFISSLSAVTQISASVSIGQLFCSHRVIGAVVTYLGLTTVTSVATYILLAILGLIDFAFTSAAEGLTPAAYMIRIFLLSGVIALATSVIFYALTNMLLRKHVNLE